MSALLYELNGSSPYADTPDFSDRFRRYVFLQEFLSPTLERIGGWRLMALLAEVGFSTRSDDDLDVILAAVVLAESGWQIDAVAAVGEKRKLHEKARSLIERFLSAGAVGTPGSYEALSNLTWREQTLGILSTLSVTLAALARHGNLREVPMFPSENDMKSACEFAFRCAESAESPAHVQALAKLAVAVLERLDFILSRPPYFCTSP